MVIVTQFLILALLALATVVAVRLLILRGLETVANQLRLNSKTKGQILGYATSLPELVVVISAARAGVFEAGFWNIASSNIINCVLFALAIVFYRQYRDLRVRAFVDEIVFGALSVVIPVAMDASGAPLSIPTAIGLIALFAVYKIVDTRLNPHVARETGPTPTTPHPKHRLLAGLGLLFAGIMAIAVCGKMIGSTADELIHSVGTPAWLVGWILGFITSVPEMSTFFGIYAVARAHGELGLSEDTQESLDTLVASNMSNLGIILPVGLIVLALV